MLGTDYIAVQGLVEAMAALMLAEVALGIAGGVLGAALYLWARDLGRAVEGWSYRRARRKPRPLPTLEFPEIRA